MVQPPNYNSINVNVVVSHSFHSNGLIIIIHKFTGHTHRVETNLGKGQLELCAEFFIAGKEAC